MMPFNVNLWMLIQTLHYNSTKIWLKVMFNSDSLMAHMTSILSTTSLRHSKQQNTLRPKTNFNDLVEVY